MKIALAQMNSVTGDLEANTKKIQSLITEAKEKGADLIVFPEMAITGYCISDLVEDNLFVEKNKELVEKIAEETKDIAAIIGFIDYEEGKTNDDGRVRKYNAAALVQKGKIKGIVHKTLLPNYRYFDDKRYFTPGKERTPFKINLNGKEITLGISICEDMWDEDYKLKPIKELAEKGAEIIINVNASPFYAGKRAVRQEIIKRHVKETNLPFVYVNTIGAADNGKNIIPFDGESLVYNKDAELIFKGKQFEEELQIVDVYEKGKKEEYKKREQEIFEALVMSVKDYAQQTGFTKAILPLSGGIDSALGLVVTVEALGKENVTAINLPSRFNTDTTKNIARDLSKNLGVEYKIIPIGEIDEKIRETYTENMAEIKNKIAKENLHARIRGILMMLNSNDENALLISNGNKTEIALGYSTLYGDMCGGISVIGDISKTDVYAIAKHYNVMKGKEIIPESIFTIKPSAELSEDQYDPFDYEIVSPLVELFIEHRLSPTEILEKFNKKDLGSKFPKKVYEIYDKEGFEKLIYDIFKLIKRSVYKRLQGPPIIAVTSRSFGFDLRETIINMWEGK